MKKKQRKLGRIEVLEARQLLAGDVIESIEGPDQPHEHSPSCTCAACLCQNLPDGHYIGDGHDHSEPIVLPDGSSYFFDPAPDPSIYEMDPVDEPTDDPTDTNDGVQSRMPLDVPIYHSNPSATKKIFLDFDGQNISGTAWNSNFFGNQTIHAPAYSTDSDTLNFSSQELARIRDIYLRVAEDFAPFNVDVTTEDPGLAVMNSSNQAIRVMISTNRDSGPGGSGQQWFSNAGGVAFLNSWGWNSDTPVWVFENNLGNGNAKSVAEAASHEVGHALSLSHDGGPGTSYYQGHGSGTTGWAPIMGVGYNRNVTQWSRGEYSGANNTENDLNRITTNARLPYRADDHSSAITNASAATPITPTSGNSVDVSGIIERSTDVDVFSIASSGTATLDLDIDPVDLGPNVDLEVTVYDSTGSVVTSSNPFSSLSANLNVTLPPGTHTVVVDGVAKGTASNGWTEYASLGQYRITGTIDLSAPPCGTPFTTSGVVGNQRPDFYYTPSTGALVVSPDDAYLQSMNIEGPSPTNDLNDPLWSYSYLNGEAQWVLAAGANLEGNPTRIATYATGMDPLTAFSCTEYGYATSDDPNAQTTNAYTDVKIDDSRPTASASLNGVSVPGAATYQFTVNYDDNVAVDPATIGDGDVRVTNTSGFNAPATLVSSSANSDGTVVATYSIETPGGFWDSTDNGVYSLRTVNNEVADLGGLFASTVILDSFQVDIENTCGTPFNFSGTMGDGHVDFYYTSSTGQVVVDSDAAFLQYMKVAGVEPNSVEFDAQFWSYSYFNGASQWFLPPGLPAYEGVSQLATYASGLNNFAALPCVEFGYTTIDDPNAQSFIAFGNVALDDDAPTATATAADISDAGGSDYQFTATHTDNVAIDPDAISNGDLIVTGPNGYSEVVSLVSTNQTGKQSIDAIYEIPANGGSWDASDNGTYTISTVGGQVTDLGGNQQTGSTTVDTFVVNITDGGNPLDIDGDGDVDPDDIDGVCLAIHQNGSTDSRFDFNNDGMVDDDDFTAYLAAAGTLPGDANFDGSVDVADFNIWNANKFTANDVTDEGVGWATADFNCDGTTDVSDFNTWNANKFTSFARPSLADSPAIVSVETEMIVIDSGTTTTAAPDLQTPQNRAADFGIERSAVRRTNDELVRVQAIDRVFEWI